MPGIVRRKKRTFKRPIVKSVKSTKLIKQIVKRELAINVEDKVVNYVDNVTFIYPSNSPGYAATVFPISPDTGYLSITQGTSQGQRVGNRIKIKKLVMSLVIVPLFYNLTTNPGPTPIEVILWIFRDREIPTTFPTQANDYLQNGGSSNSLQNNLTDISAMVNNDRYKLFLRKVYKVGYSSFEGTGASVTDQFWQNNDYKYNHIINIDCTKYLAKHIVYNDNTSSPTTPGVFCILQAVRADGQAFNSATIPASYSTNLNCTYEDA